ncbi:MAG: hypothetical protein ACRBFS_14585 [Aureispira sp.]
MNHILISLLLGLWHHASFAQRTDLTALQANPDILWIGELEVDYIPKYGASSDAVVSRTLLHEWFGVYLDRNQLLKSTNQNEEGLRRRASQLIVELVDAAPILEAYADAELTQKLSPKAIQKCLEFRDTFSAIDAREMPILLDSSGDLFIPAKIKEYHPLIAIKAIRTKQLLYYNRKKLAFEAKILAVAPLVVGLYKDDLEFEWKRPAFWLKPENLTTRPDWKAESITWAQQFYTHYKVKKTIVRKAIQPLAQVINGSIEAFKAQETTIYLGGPSYKAAEEEIIAFDWSQLDSFSTDTIIRFDLETFEEMVEIKKERFEGRQIERLLLLQEFYWDATKKKLGIYPLGFGYVNRITNKTYFIRLPFKDQSAILKEKN